MKIKTKELNRAAIDWAVAVCEGLDPFLDKAHFGKVYRYATFVGTGRRLFAPSDNWVQGGPIIEREGISLLRLSNDWEAQIDCTDSSAAYATDGPTPLVAAMRCFVASRLGDEVDIPEVLA